MDNDAKVNLMNEDVHEWADDHKGQEFFGIKWEHSRDRRLIVAYRVKEELENLERRFSEEQNPSAAHSVRLCIEAIDGIEGTAQYAGPSISSTCTSGLMTTSRGTAFHGAIPIHIHHHQKRGRH